jgi:glyoxylase-like metal-dependent hydrolase (beta-lactamase superfamily II)
MLGRATTDAIEHPTCDRQGGVTSADDWTAPGAHPVAPGVHRIPLPLPNDGLRAVNVYALSADDGLTLIDAGWAIDAAYDVLVRALRSLGAEVADVRRCLVTHVHRDHYTQALTLRREAGTTVALGRGERPTLEYLQRPEARPLGPALAALRALGAVELADRIAAAVHDRPVDVRLWESPDDWLDEGVVALPGGRALHAVQTPGHTAGHLVFHDEAGGLLFAGDHVLPTITPSIGFEPVLTANPLGDFLGSLALVRRRPDARLLPAHGPVADSVHARIDELVAHHGRRLDEVADAVRSGASTAAQVARRLRWTKRGRAFDELDDFNAMLAVFETAAHATLLVAQGRLVEVTTSAGRGYAAAT